MHEGSSCVSSDSIKGPSSLQPCNKTLTSWVYRAALHRGVRITGRSRSGAAVLRGAGRAGHAARGGRPAGSGGAERPPRCIAPPISAGSGRLRGGGGTASRPREESGPAQPRAPRAPRRHAAGSPPGREMRRGRPPLRLSRCGPSSAPARRRGLPAPLRSRRDAAAPPPAEPRPRRVADRRVADRRAPRPAAPLLTLADSGDAGPHPAPRRPTRGQPQPLFCVPASAPHTETADGPGKLRARIQTAAREPAWRIARPPRRLGEMGRPPPRARLARASRPPCLSPSASSRRAAVLAPRSAGVALRSEGAAPGEAVRRSWKTPSRCPAGGQRAAARP